MSPKLAEKQLSLAVRVLGDLVFDALLEAGRPLPQQELDSALEERLGKPLFPLATRKVMREDSRIVSQEGEFDLVARSLLPDRSIDSGARHLLLAAGRPLSLESLANELALAKTRSADSLAELLVHLASAPGSAYVLRGELLYLKQWLLVVEENNEEAILLDNFIFELEALQHFLASVKLPSRKPKSPLALVEKLLKDAKEPLPNKYLQYAVWKVFGELHDPVALFEEMQQQEFTYLVSGPAWLPTQEALGLEKTLTKFSTELEKQDKAELAKLNLPVLLKQPAPREQQFAISARDKEHVHTYLAEHEEPTELSDILRDVFGVYPSDEQFLAAAHALNERLQQDERFVLGEKSETAWMVTEEVPEDVRILPARLLPVVSKAMTSEGEPVDAELEDEGLVRGMVDLSDFVHAPELEDVGEEDEVDPDIIPDEPPTEIELPLLYHHFMTGILKYRKLDWGFFPEEEDLVRVTFVDEEDDLYNGWVNNELGIIYGLSKWFEKYHERGLSSTGSLIKLKATDEPGTYQVLFENKQHDKLFIPPERLEELIGLRQAFDLHKASTFDLLCAVLENQQDGLAPEALWSQLNVLRRTSKRLVASLLAGYVAFNPSRFRPDRWVYDPRRKGQGRMRDKRQYIITPASDSDGEEEGRIDADSVIDS